MTTWGDLIDQARFLLQDTVESRYRYANEQLLAACHLACLTTKAVRPDLFFGRSLAEGSAGGCFPAPPYEESQYATYRAYPAPVAEIYHQPFIFFIAGYVEIVNEEYTGADRAGALLASFRRQLLQANMT